MLEYEKAPQPQERRGARFPTLDEMALIVQLCDGQRGTAFSTAVERKGELRALPEHSPKYTMAGGHTLQGIC